MPQLSTFHSQLSASPAALPYNSELSLWLSVDPLSDKYPGSSPYVYCADNPVRLVDVDGREIGDVDEASRKKINALTDKNSADYSRAFTRQYRRLERSKQVYNFYEATPEQVTGEVKGKIFKEEDGTISIIYSTVEECRTSYKGGFSMEYASIFEETYHAVDYDRGRLDYDHPTCIDEARAWKFATKAPGTKLSYGLTVKTFAGVIASGTTIQDANLLHSAALGDDFEGAWNVCQGEDDKGLYNHLPLKRKK